MNLLLDEHIAPLFRVQLRRRLPDLVVWEVGDIGAPPKGTLDPDILIWCEAHDFLLVTNNRKSMPVHLTDHLVSGRHIPGILTIDLSEPEACCCKNYRTLSNCRSLMNIEIASNMFR